MLSGRHLNMIDQILYVDIATVNAAFIIHALNKLPGQLYHLIHCSKCSYHIISFYIVLVMVCQKSVLADLLGLRLAPVLADAGCPADDGVGVRGSGETGTFLLASCETSSAGRCLS